MFSKMLLVTATAMKIPITNEVIINGNSMGTGSDLEAYMGMCHSESYNPPLSMGIIEKGQTVKVVGSEVKVVLHMRGRCEKYGSYDYDVGACEPGTAADGETISKEYTTDHTIQSYEIEPCGGAMAARETLKGMETWQDVMPPLPEELTPSCKEQFTSLFGPYMQAAAAYEQDGGYRGPNSEANRATLRATWKPIRELMWGEGPCKLHTKDGENLEAYQEAREGASKEHGVERWR